MRTQERIRRFTEFLRPATSVSALGLTGQALSRIAISTEVAGMIPQKLKQKVRDLSKPLAIEVATHNVDEVSRIKDEWVNRSIISVHYRPETHVGQLNEFQQLVEKVQEMKPPIPYVSLHLEHIWDMMTEDKTHTKSLGEVLTILQQTVKCDDSGDPQIRLLFENTSRRSDIGDALPEWTYSFKSLLQNNDFTDLLNDPNRMKYFGFCPDLSHMGIADQALYNRMLSYGHPDPFYYDPLSHEDIVLLKQMRQVFSNSPLVHWSRTAGPVRRSVVSVIDKMRIPQKIRENKPKLTFRLGHDLIQAKLTNLLAAHRPFAGDHNETIATLNSLQDLGFNGTFVIEAPYILGIPGQLSLRALITNMFRYKRVYIGMYPREVLSLQQHVYMYHVIQ